jgi:23S rRNA pseudouridine2605 synthase
MTEKLQKVLARQGLGSRREIERWIADGRIKVNKETATLGDRVAGDENITLDGKRLRLKPPEEQHPRVIVYHKDVGTICSRTDDNERRTVFEDFPKVHNGRWILIGRLDVTTTGLLLATTDGELANRLMHPRYEIKREYAVRVYGEVTAEMLQRLQEGVELDDGPAHFDVIEPVGGEGRNQWFTVVLHEGRNREVRRLWETQGVQVNRLARNRFGPVALPRRLKRGDWEELAQPQVEQLYTMTGLASPFTPKATTRPRKHVRSSKKSTGRRKKRA